MNWLQNIYPELIFPAFFMAVTFYCMLRGASITKSNVSVFKMTPAYWIAESIAIGRPTPLGILGVIIAAVLVVITANIPIIREFVLVFFLGLIPLLLVNFTAKVKALRNVKYVYINPFKPVSLDFKREMKDGLVSEIRQQVYLYMPSSAWDLVSKSASPFELKKLSSMRVKGAPDLVSAEVTNSFMQLFDSMKLGRFVIHPDNKDAMDAIVRAMSGERSIPQPQQKPKSENRKTESEKAESTTDSSDEFLDDDGSPFGTPPVENEEEIQSVVSAATVAGRDPKGSPSDSRVKHSRKLIPKKNKDATMTLIDIPDEIPLDDPKEEAKP